MPPILSLIICTHNPRRDYLDRVLQALKAQTLPVEQWELLLIDNASDRMLSKEIDLSWHPLSRHIQEEQLGLTPARLRGIKEAAAEILVFIDDDNVLDKDYLENAIQIWKTCAFLGAWSGQLIAEFDVPPPEWIKSHLYFLAIREFTSDRWSNSVDTDETVPWGAGLCVRSEVAYKYMELVRDNPYRKKLGVKGKELLRCEDMDLAFTACDIGLGRGIFTKLKLTHLIPAFRFEKSYLLKLSEGNGYSQTILEYIRGKIPVAPKATWEAKLIEFYKFFRMKRLDWELYRAYARGRKLALRELTKS